MKSQTEAMRALAYVTASARDAALRHDDRAVRRDNQAFVDLMIPVVKGWSTETAIDIASLGVQVHGGMGFVEETGAAQYYRDARITTIYEGTTGIQANDLVGRKIARDSGAAVKAYLARLRRFDSELARSPNPDIEALRGALDRGVVCVSDCVDFILGTMGGNADAAYAGAVPFLKLMGIVAGGWQMARAALAAERALEAGSNTDDLFHQAKIATARFYGDHVLSQAGGLAAAVTNGSAAVLAMSEAHFL
jgi:acyl-CoA dehydrogenase